MALEPHEMQLLVDTRSDAAATKAAVHEINEGIQRQLQAQDKRIDDVRQEAADDIKAVRGEQKRTIALISTLISAVVGSVTSFFGGNG